MAVIRTRLTLILVIVILTQCYSDSDGPEAHNYASDDIAVDHLLRGSREDIEDDIHIPVETFNEFRGTIDKNDDISIPKFVTIDDYKTTIDYQTTTEVPGYKEFEDHDEHVYRNESDVGDTSVTAIDSSITEPTEYTMSLDNIFYSRKDSDEDIYNSSSGSNYIEEKFETTTTISSTTKATDDIEVLRPKKEDLDEDVEVTGLRNPKTENKEPKQQADKRNFEEKPHPSIAVSKSSKLKSWLEDTWLRPPAGVLVPLRPMALNRALAVWNDLTAVEGLNVSDIVIVGYDSNGVNWRSRHNLQGSSGSGHRAVAEALSKLLLKYQGVHRDMNGDGTMRALASAAKLVPYDSALFVVTDKGPGDPQRLPLALRALVEKRLKVYTIWTDPNYPSTESELSLQELKNISRHTEGGVLPYSMHMETDGSASMASEPEQWSNLQMASSRRAKIYAKLEDETFDTLLVRRGGGGAISLGFPVENGVTGLRVYIEGAVEHAVLYPPNDAPQIDLYNESSVSAFSPASKTGKLIPRDVYLVFPGADLDMDTLSVLPASSSSEASAVTVGLWHLSVRCDTCDYRLLVSARGLVHLDTNIAGDMLKLRVDGPVASVRESLLVDEYGAELAKLPFSYQPMAEGHEEPLNAPGPELDTTVPLPNVKGSRVYAKIVGRDVRGEPFVRLSGPLKQKSEVRMSRSAAIVFPDSGNDLEQVEQYNSDVYNSRLTNNSSINSRAMSQVLNQRGSILTSVQIGLGSRLYGSPGDNLDLHFEVSNYREQAVRFSFIAVGEQRFLRGISTNSQVINAGQTANIIVSVGITRTAQPGVTDLITFTARGLEDVSISTYVYVINAETAINDVWSPEVRHSFQGSCIGKQGADCAQHAWSTTVIARDSLGGLLRITSSPLGLFYENSFIAGSRQEVMATYRATCCAPRVVVTAVDAYGNANSYIIDISNYFTPASIGAIVLGVILVIVLIALVVFFIIWCVRRRRESRELPSYNTSSSRNIS